ncbi:MAG: mandelate racemase/muconate lactonizing enzyme family protein [Alphaproteobacteria bacterium]|nr:mandelate racemase/muconate lactonizing enzyme family protein [Alphaproteobacteria bacterium]
MKIARVKADIANLPADEPLADAPGNPNETRPIVVLDMATDDGIEGLGVTFFGGPMTGALRTAVEELGTLAIGMDPSRPEAIAMKLRNAMGTSVLGGAFTLAQSAVDMALWDIRAKALNLPLWRLLGGARDRIPTYASGALMRSLTDDQVVKAGRTLVERGFKQMKTQLALPGDTSPAKEVARARLVREAVGPDITLMCDINQRWRPEQAIDIGRRVEDVNFFWLEDVTTADDYQGLARITAALKTPIAGGEYVFGIVPFRHMLAAHAVDIPMVDLVRVGGITQWLKVAGMCEAYNLPIVSHLIPEVHVHLVAAVPNGLTVEYMPWLRRLFQEVPMPKNGELVMPTKPGLGLSFDRDALKKFKP